MTKNIYYVGIDIAAENFVVSIYQSPQKPVITKEVLLIGAIGPIRDRRNRAS